VPCRLSHPFPGEPLLSVSDLAERSDCSRQAIHDAVRNGKLAAFQVAGRVLIPENDAKRFISEWPNCKKGVAARWREFREWQAHERTVPRQRLPGKVETEGTTS
jgi:hypothetical protein